MIYTEEKIKELIEAGKAEIVKTTVKYARIRSIEGRIRVFITVEEEFDGDVAEGNRDARTHMIGKVNYFAVDVAQLRATLHECGKAGDYAASQFALTSTEDKYGSILKGCTINILRHHIAKDEEYETESLRGKEKITNPYDWFVTNIRSIVLTDDAKKNAMIHDDACPNEVKMQILSQFYGL